ncbi:MAG: MBL fold metallo-hydrolase [Lentisphaerae bacterium]|nr:MAG: MBL fold metallo-hydrolase [Lentisphaerota bacterium]
MSIKLHFLGAAGNVTGSRYLVELNSTRILVDCGLYQERDYQDRNYEPFLFSPEKLSAVILTHSHLDHCGLLPKLVKDGFRGPIFTTGATAEIAPIVMYDTAHLQQEDLLYKKKRLEREGRQPKHPLVPLYTERDVDATVSLLKTVAFNELVSVAPGVEAVFHEAGHILGASMVRLCLHDSDRERTIVFTGDVGRWNRPIIHDPDPFEQADYVLTEATYGDRVHPPAEDLRKNLTEVILWTVQHGGNVVIPSFAIERSQEVLYHLDLLFQEKLIPPLPTFLDSPMAVRVTEVFNHHPELMNEELQQLLKNHESPFSFKGLQLVQSVQQSKAINNVKGTAIIIAGAGMCTGGRIKHHLAHNISRAESCICFVGYQAEGTLGRQIVSGESPVRIHGEYMDVKARIVQLHGFSGHGDKHDLLRVLRMLNSAPRKVFVVHAGEDVGTHFSSYLYDKTGWDVVVPRFRDCVVLD